MAMLPADGGIASDMPETALVGCAPTGDEGGGVGFPIGLPPVSESPTEENAENAESQDGASALEEEISLFRAFAPFGAASGSNGGAGGAGGAGGMGGLGGAGGLIGTAGNGSAGIELSGLDNSVDNRGSILGGDSGGGASLAGSGILVQAGATAEITNRGIIAGGENGGGGAAYGIENLGSISRLSNSQGGDVAALIYWGDLPDFYDVLVDSPTRFGQLTAMNANPNQSMVVGLGSAPTGPSGFYAKVVSGVAAADVANEGLFTFGQPGMLSVLIDATLRPGGLVNDWDLGVLNYGLDLAETQSFLLNQQTLSIRQALTHDCDLFDENGLGFAWLGQYDAYERSNLDGGSHSELSGTMVGAKRINEQMRVGGFLSWQLHSDDFQGVENLDGLPIMGAFAGYSQMKNGEGLQVHVAAAYQQGDADFSRVNLHGGVNPVMSEADIESYGLGADAGWGIVLKDQQVVTPFVSLNFVKSTRDDYREKTVAIDSLSYDSYSAAYTVGELGVRVNGPVAKQVNYRLSVGLENVLSGDIETFRLSTSTGSGFYDSRAELDGWSLNTSAGLSYMIDESKALTLDGYIRQAEGGLSNSGLSLGYKAGF
jgi:uncharacterized protein YhjY with autotransporter beta-barrel domain